VVLSAALGGCAESVGNEPASFASINRPSIALSRFAAPQSEPDAFQALKTESVASRPDTKHQVRSVVADTR
jgi:hypothetical protein